MSARKTVILGILSGTREFFSMPEAMQIADLPAADRLALARALVADMPGVVVAQMPDAWLVPAEKNTPYNKGRRRGWNDFRTELISAGSATHQPKEPTDAG